MANNVTMPLRVALVLLALSAGLWAFQVTQAPDTLVLPARFAMGPAVVLAVGWLLIAAALVQFRSRPRSAVLSYLIGLWWFLALLRDPATSSAVGFTTGLVLATGGPAVVGHLLLAHPTGTIRPPFSRLIVAAGYIITLGLLGVVRTATLDPSSMGCSSCARNLLLISPDSTWSDSVATVGTRLLIGWLLLVIVLGVWRLIAAPVATRRSIRLVGIPALTTLGTLLLSELTIIAPVGSIPGDRLVLWQIVACSLAGLAVATAGDVAWTRRDRRNLAISLVAGAADRRELRSTLAERLHDPELLLAYPVDGDRLVTVDGEEMALPPTTDQVVTRLCADEQDLAVLVHRPGLLVNKQQIAELIDSVRLGLENERLFAEDRAQLARLRESGRRLVTAGDLERLRIERDLHDGAQQRLVGILLQLSLLRLGQSTAASSAGRTHFDEDDLDRVATYVRAAAEDLRGLAHRLDPALLRDAGLRPALLAAFGDTSVVVTAPADRRYPALVELTVFRLVQARLAGGTGSAEILDDDERLTVTIVSPAPGMEAAEPVDPIKTLGARIQALGGRLESIEVAGNLQTVMTLPLS